MNRARRACLLLTAALALTGCVDRKIRVTSEPPGARVWLNDVEIGRTPAEADFTYYGRYDVRLELDGYEPLWTDREAKAPFWQWPGPDLVAEAIPARFDDVVEWHFDLEPSLEAAVPYEDLRGGLIERARELRQRTVGEPLGPPAPANATQPEVPAQPKAQPETEPADVPAPELTPAAADEPIR